MRYLSVQGHRLKNACGNSMLVFINYTVCRSARAVTRTRKCLNVQVTFVGRNVMDGVNKSDVWREVDVEKTWGAFFESQTTEH